MSPARRSTRPASIRSREGSSSYYPLPNIATELAKAGVPGSFGNPNYFSSGLLNSNINQFDGRVDHTFGSGRDRLFGRFSYMRTHRLEPPALDDPIANGNFASDTVNTGQNGVVGWSRVIGEVDGQRVPRRLEPGRLRFVPPGPRRRRQQPDRA